MGIGSPDLRPPKSVIKAIQGAVQEDGAHKYQSYQGLPTFREAVSQFYSSCYKVNINANSEVLPLMGSKEGILHVSVAFLNKGDQVLIPNPGYPTYTSVSHLVKKRQILSITISLLGSNWEPDLHELEQQDLSKLKLCGLIIPICPQELRGVKRCMNH